MTATNQTGQAIMDPSASARQSVSDSSSPASPASPTSPTGLSHDELVQALREELVEISEGELGLDEIDPKGHLFDFGYVDSLRAVMLLARIEERFGVEIDDMELFENLTTVDAIAVRVREGS